MDVAPPVVATRTRSRLLGVAFLAQALTSLASGTVWGRLWDLDGGADTGLARIAAHATFARAGILVDLATAVGVVVLGAALAVTLRRHGPVLALAGFGLYVVEGALVAAGTADAFRLVRTAQEYVAAGRPADLLPAARLASESASFTGGTLSMAAFCAGAACLYRLLHRSRIVHRAWSVWGLAGVALCAVGTVLAVLGHPAGDWPYVPYAPFEFALGGWLTVRGVEEEDS